MTEEEEEVVEEDDDCGGGGGDTANDIWLIYCDHNIQLINLD